MGNVPKILQIGRSGANRLWPFLKTLLFLNSNKQLIWIIGVTERQQQSQSRTKKWRYKTITPTQKQNYITSEQKVTSPSIPCLAKQASVMALGFGA